MRDELTNALSQIGEVIDEYLADVAMEPVGYERFLTVRKGMKLARFSSPEKILLVAKRPASDSNPAAVFTINIDRENAFVTIRRDKEVLWSICGGALKGGSSLEKLAVSTLHAYFKRQRPSGHKRKKLREAKEQQADDSKGVGSQADNNKAKSPTDRSVEPCPRFES